MAGQILSTQALISQKAELFLDVQSNASNSAIGLVETLAKMTDTAHIELDKINESAWLIQEQLRFQEDGNLQWKGWLMNILAFIYRGVLHHSIMIFHFVNFFSRSVFLRQPRQVVIVSAILTCCYLLLECVSINFFRVYGEIF